MVGNLEEFGDSENLLRSACLIGIAYALTGRVSRGLGMIEAVRSKAELLDHREVIMYCDYTTAVVLMELRKVAEAEPYVKRLSGLSDEMLGPFLSWMLCDQRSYILCRRQDYKGALEELHKTLALSRFLGRTHSPHSWTFETLDILERRGIFSSGREYGLLLKKHPELG